MDSFNEFLVFCFVIIFIVGFIGNSLIVWLFGSAGNIGNMKFKRLIMILAIFDMMASILNPSHFIYRITTEYLKWESGEFGCRLLSAIYGIFSSISLGIILILAIDYDRTVTAKFKKQFDIVHIHAAVIINIFLSTIVFIPYISNLQVADYMGGNVCAVFNTGNDYHKGTVSLILISDILFLVILGTTTLRVWLKLRKAKITGSKTKIGDRGMLRIILTMGIVFGICIFPRDILLASFHLKKVFPPLIDGLESEKANGLLKVLQTSYSCMNFIIYMVLNPVFRNELCKKLKGLKKIRKNAVSPIIASPEMENHSDRHQEETKIEIPEDYDQIGEDQEECKIDIPEECNQSNKDLKELKTDVQEIYTPTQEPEVEITKNEIQADIINVEPEADTPINSDVEHEVPIAGSLHNPDVEHEVPSSNASRSPDKDQEELPLN